MDALVLVSCVGKKSSESSPARLLYQSEWFIKVRLLVETQGAEWLILSALYGVVEPNIRISPYERTLNKMDIADRRAWAGKIREQLNPHLSVKRRIVIFAGQRYREFLEPILCRDGHEVEVPMKSLRIGEQLSWLNRQR